MTHEQAEALRDIARGQLQRISVPRHCGPGVPAPCSCLWECGQWFPCVEHATPHEQHVTPAPWCDACEQDGPFVDSDEYLSTLGHA